MSGDEIAIAILRHMAFLIWLVFTLWYGTFRRWESSEYGVNTFLVSLAITSITGLLVLRVYVPADYPFLIFMQIPVYVIVCATGIHRLALLKFGNKRDGRKRNREEDIDV